MLKTPGRSRRSLALAAAGAVGLSTLIGLAAPAQAAPAGVVTVDILGINDFHGRIVTGEQDQTPTGAYLAATLDHYRSLNPDSLFVSAGDNIGASTFVSFSQQDNPTIDTLNAMGLVTSAVGNHEFDAGFANLTGPVADRALFDYLGANVYNAGTTTPALPEYSVIETVSGVTVGFVGVVTQETPGLVTPAGIAGLEFGDPTTALNRVADQLTDNDPANGEADVVVALVHEGANTSDCALVNAPGSFGSISNGANANVSAILSGHTHVKYNCAYPVPGWDAGLLRPVVQTGSYAANLERVSITLTDGVVTGLASEVVTVGNTYGENAAVRAITDAAVAAAAVPGAVELGTITSDIKRAFTSATPPAENRGAESQLGNLVADIQLAATADPARGGAQIAFMNPGGLRTDLLYNADGVITYREAANVQPFANSIFTETLTGAQIKAVLGQQVQPLIPPAGSAPGTPATEVSSRPYLQLGVSKGFEYTYTYVPSVTGSRGSLTVVDASLNGVPIVDGQSYRVALNSFLVSGGDNFTTFAAGTDKRDSGVADLQATVDYFSAYSPVAPDPQERAVDLAYVYTGDVAVELAVIPTPVTDQPSVATATVTASAAVPGPLSVIFTVLTTDGTLLDSVTVDLPDGLVAGPQEVPTEIVAPAGTVTGLYLLSGTLASPLFDRNQFAGETFTASQEILITGVAGGALGSLTDTLLPAEGGPVSFVVSGFDPNETVVVTLGDGTVLGTFTADDFGTFTGQVVLPGLAAGDYELIFTGQTSGVVLSLPFSITLEADPERPLGGGQNLAATGGREQQALSLGVILVLLGSAALFAGRRRRGDLL